MEAGWKTAEGMTPPETAPALEQGPNYSCLRATMSNPSFTSSLTRIPDPRV